MQFRQALAACCPCSCCATPAATDFQTQYLQANKIRCSHLLTGKGAVSPGLAARFPSSCCAASSRCQYGSNSPHVLWSAVCSRARRTGKGAVSPGLAGFCPCSCCATSSRCAVAAMPAMTAANCTRTASSPSFGTSDRLGSTYLHQNTKADESGEEGKYLSRSQSIAAVNYTPSIPKDSHSDADYRAAVSQAASRRCGHGFVDAWTEYMDRRMCGTGSVTHSEMSLASPGGSDCTLASTAARQPSASLRTAACGSETAACTITTPDYQVDVSQNLLRCTAVRQPSASLPTATCDSDTAACAQ